MSLDSGLGIRDSKVRLAGATVMLPCVVLAALSTWWFVAGLAGHGLWPPDDVTLAEAVATRNNAEALRLIALGSDPNSPSRVRDGLLTNGYDVLVTPVEAAGYAGRPLLWVLGLDEARFPLGLAALPSCVDAHVSGKANAARPSRRGCQRPAVPSATFISPWSRYCSVQK